MLLPQSRQVKPSRVATMATATPTWDGPLTWRHEQLGWKAFVPHAYNWFSPKLWSTRT